MKTYYIRYDRDFANTYDLCYCQTSEEEKEAESAGFKRISRLDAFRKCANEKWARTHDKNFSGSGDVDIVPWRIMKWNLENHDDPMLPAEMGLHRNGYVWE